jgi:hypothetical protein
MLGGVVRLGVAESWSAPGATYKFGIFLSLDPRWIA